MAGKISQGSWSDAAAVSGQRSGNSLHWPRTDHSGGDGIKLKNGWKGGCRQGNQLRSRGQKRLNIGEQLRQTGLQRRPDPFDINIPVVMDEFVTHPSDRPPINS